MGTHRKIGGAWVEDRPLIVPATLPPRGARQVVAPETLATLSGNCKYFGAATGERIVCTSCRGRVELDIFTCAKLGKCTPKKPAPGLACCAGQINREGRFEPCPGYDPKSDEQPTATRLRGPVEYVNGGRPAAWHALPANVRDMLTAMSANGNGKGKSPQSAIPQGVTATAETPTSVEKPAAPAPKLKWACGVTTVPDRREVLLPRTLASLELAGFGKPRLFVDGERGMPKWLSDLETAGYDVTVRWPKIRTHGNWILTLYELFIRNPNADRYAVFQDDMVTYLNLRAYLDASAYPEKGYLNLYTFPVNQELAPKVGLTGRTRAGWFLSNQKGKGAVATVFSRPAALALLAHPHMVERPMDCGRGHEAVDGGIVTALAKAGYAEYVHNPSLVQHTGLVSSMRHREFPQAPSFRGEGFDAMELLKETANDNGV